MRINGDGAPERHTLPVDHLVSGTFWCLARVGPAQHLEHVLAESATAETVNGKIGRGVGGSEEVAEFMDGLPHRPVAIIERSKASEHSLHNTGGHFRHNEHSYDNNEHASLLYARGTLWGELCPQTRSAH